MLHLDFHLRGPPKGRLQGRLVDPELDDHIRYVTAILINIPASGKAGGDPAAVMSEAPDSDDVRIQATELFTTIS
ncbi:hypothetical protein GCM10009020_09290 [Natronoarchaeum mannanilyticum]|uniref:Uncharacterized protein n=1 Tax=Natronoarchaeum mannanilyticum TaxID=926360 RepID=A0AAV3T794_9EURY